MCFESWISWIYEYVCWLQKARKGSSLQALFPNSLFSVRFSKCTSFSLFHFLIFHIGSRYFGSMRPPVGRGRSVIVSITEAFSFQSSIWHAILKDVHIFWRIWSHEVHPGINRSSSANVGGSTRRSVATRILQLLIRGAQIGSSGFFCKLEREECPNQMKRREQQKGEQQQCRSFIFMTRPRFRHT